MVMLHASCGSIHSWKMSLHPHAHYFQGYCLWLLHLCAHSDSESRSSLRSWQLLVRDTSSGASPRWGNCSITPQEDSNGETNGKRMEYNWSRRRWMEPFPKGMRDPHHHLASSCPLAMCRLPGCRNYRSGICSRQYCGLGLRSGLSRWFSAYWMAGAYCAHTQQQLEVG